jgi:NDP-sugar pyrophosphorylase family protein
VAQDSVAEANPIAFNRESHTGHGRRTGYKASMIKEDFSNYFMRSPDAAIYARNNQINPHNVPADCWRVTFIDSGETSMTGGPLKKVASYLDPHESFCVTYGDGVATVQNKSLLESLWTDSAAPGKVWS